MMLRHVTLCLVILHYFLRGVVVFDYARHCWMCCLSYFMCCYIINYANVQESRISDNVIALYASGEDCCKIIRLTSYDLFIYHCAWSLSTRSVRSIDDFNLMKVVKNSLVFLGFSFYRRQHWSSSVHVAWSFKLFHFFL